MTVSELEELIGLLRRRLDTIADHELRAQDPAKQLSLLQEISEAITAFHQRHQGALPPRLNHFLQNCSYQKALEWAEAERTRG
jgi:hypothetical protein